MTAEHPRPTPIAPWWHSLIIIAIMVGIAIPGMLNGGAGIGAEAIKNLPPDTMGKVRLINYAVTIAYQWIVVLIIWWGVRLRGQTFASLFGKTPADGKSIARDLGIAVIFLVGANLALGLILMALKQTQSEALTELMPHNTLEMALFLLLVATAGICEEVIFRGYLQRQFAGWTGRAWIGIALQATVFGLGHAYQGWVMVPVLALYGAMFGVLAWWRRSLHPGIFAHVLHDGLAGLIFALMLK